VDDTRSPTTLIIEARRNRAKQLQSVGDRYPPDIGALELTCGMQAPFGISQFVHWGPHLGVETRHPSMTPAWSSLVFETPLRPRCRSTRGNPYCAVRSIRSCWRDEIMAWRNQGAEFTSFLRAALFSSEGAHDGGLLRESARGPGAGQKRGRGQASSMSPAKIPAEEGARRAFCYESWLRRVRNLGHTELPNPPIEWISKVGNSW